MSAPVATLTPDWCRYARQDLSWTQAELGARSGVPPVELARFEDGRRGLGRDVLTALRDALVAAGADMGRYGRPPASGATALGPGLPITPGQCFQACEALGWPVGRLTREAGVDIKTVGRFQGGTTLGRSDPLPRMRRSLETAGVEFLEDGGVRLRVRQAGG